MIKLNSTAYHLEQHISIVAALEVLDFQVSKSENDFALFEVGENAWVYIKNFGSIVFINVSEKAINRVLNVFLEQAIRADDLPSEDFVIEVDAGKDLKVQYGVITMDQINLDVAHIIAFHLAQTVTLDHFQNEVEELMSSTTAFSFDLTDRGKIFTSRRKIRQMIGLTMVLKNKVAENLYIYETPDVAWSDQVLSRTDEQMRQDLDIDKRHQGLQFNLSIIKENLDMYQNILQHRHSSTLEWIIIILILFEVLQVIIE